MNGGSQKRIEGVDVRAVSLQDIIELEDLKRELKGTAILLCFAQDTLKHEDLKRELKVNNVARRHKATKHRRISKEN